MSPWDRLDGTIRRSLGLSGEAELSGAAYGQTDGWDSVGHVQLMLALEETFGVVIDPDDVFAMSDYATIHRVFGRYIIEAGRQ